MGWGRDGEREREGKRGTEREKRKEGVEGRGWEGWWEVE